MSLRQWPALRPRNRHHRNIFKLAVQRNHVRKIQAPVKRSQMIQPPFAAQSKMKVVRMKVDDVELASVFSHLLQHQDVMRQIIAAIRIRSQRSRAARYQSRARLGIAAGKERDFVSETNQFFGQPGNDALSSTISRRWDSFIERRNLGNIHEGSKGCLLTLEGATEANNRENAVAWPPKQC